MCKAGFVCEAEMRGILNWKQKVELLTSCFIVLCCPHIQKRIFSPKTDPERTDLNIPSGQYVCCSLVSDSYPCVESIKNLRHCQVVIRHLWVPSLHGCGIVWMLGDHLVLWGLSRLSI